MENTHLVAAMSGLVGALLGAGGIAPVVIAYGSHKRQTFIDAHRAMSEMFAQLSTRIENVEHAERQCIEAKEELLTQMIGMRTELEMLKSSLKKES